MLVRIVKDWQWPDIFQQTPQNKGVWEGIRFTEEEVEECDLLVVLNAPSKKIITQCPVGARWLFSQESPVDLYRYYLKAAPYFDKYFCFWNSAEATTSLIHRQRFPGILKKRMMNLLIFR